MQSLRVLKSPKEPPSVRPRVRRLHGAAPKPTENERGAVTEWVVRSREPRRGSESHQWFGDRFLASEGEDGDMSVFRFMELSRTRR